MTALEIALLGDLRLWSSDRRSIEIVSRKGVQLLAVLALPPGRKHRREVLQALLWPDSDPRHAQGNLRFVLHHLRRVLGSAGGLLRSHSRWIWLDPDQVNVDVLRFETLAEQGTLESLEIACSLYTGDFLADAADVGSEYEDWLLPERERLRELARSAFWSLFSLRLWRGEIREARACAQRYLEIDPTSERMHAALMRLYLTQGERALALRRYHQLRFRLAQDHQIRPRADVEQLARSLSQPGGRPAPQSLDAAWILGRRDTPSTDKPLVLVLPFKGMSEDRPLANLPAALTEDVIADLARFRSVAVLARHTSFTIGGDPDAESRVRQLGVHYSVEGSIRRTGNRVSVTVRLVENNSSQQVWGERYQGDWDELPSFQEQVARAIVAAIPVQVEQAELERVRHQEISSLSSYELCLLAREHQRSTAHDSHTKAVECFSRALDLDSRSAPAHSGLALSMFLEGGCTRIDEDGRRLKKAIRHAQQATELDPLHAQGHWMVGMLLQMLREFGTARLHLDRAMTLSPGDAETLAYTGLEYAYAGDPTSGVSQSRRAIQLNPSYPPAFVELLGKSCFVGRHYQEALFWLRQSPDRVCTNRAWLAAAAAYAGLKDEAERHAGMFMATLRQCVWQDSLRASGGPIGWLREPARFQYAADLEHYEQGLTMAGIQERGSMRDSAPP
jgi:DNA-binding SARP family transcriptional activator/TolB-like protein